jgi:hypothetical protein
VPIHTSTEKQEQKQILVTAADTGKALRWLKQK